MKKNAQRARRGFTLVEMMVVMGIIVLVCSMALPSIIRLFNAGSDAQAYNLLAAHLVAARALAIQNNAPAGVHVRMADNLTLLATKPELANVCYMGVVQAVNTAPAGATIQWRFGPGGGYYPVRVPGTMAFGQLDHRHTTTSNDFLSGTAYVSIADGIGLTGIRDFTTFTIAFTGGGAVVARPDGGDVLMDLSTALYAGATALWDATFPDTENGAMSVAMFDYVELRARSAGDRATYLNENGQILAVNIFTGQLFPRK